MAPFNVWVGFAGSPPPPTLYQVTSVTYGTDTVGCISATSITDLYSTTSSAAWTGFYDGQQFYYSNGNPYNGLSQYYTENSLCTYCFISSVGIASGKGNCTSCA